MRGKHRVIVSTKRLKYDFEIRRNLTIIRGDSATGKTTLVDLIQEYVNNPPATPVDLTSDKKCYVLEGALWKGQLTEITDSIVFIDEGNDFIKTEEFAGVIQKTDNYYVIVTRESLSTLPYSVEEIYGIRTSGKYGTLKQSYHEFYRIYGTLTHEKEVNPELVITEDSNSGYQFFDHVCRENYLQCETMNGKSNVFALWKGQLTEITDSIVFIDEGNDFIKTEEFAGVIQKTDNYYVIVTRESLSTLPYSVEEIYGIRTSGKYGTLKQSYHEFYRIYGTLTHEKEVNPELVITEDSNSGYQFFDHVCRENYLQCETMNGKSNVFHYLREHQNEKILVIADGAAFGSEIDRVLRLIEGCENVALYLPESFEWLILSAGILKNNYVDAILDAPYDYVNSEEFFSWERFFTTVLMDETKDTYLAYMKKRLNPTYLQDVTKVAILEKIFRM